MALEITGIKRVFTFKKGTATITLDDPNPSDSPEMVMGFYSNTYPELTTATVHGPTMKDDAAGYEFKLTSGTKGEQPMAEKPEKENHNRLLSEGRSEQLAKLLRSQTERR